MQNAPWPTELCFDTDQFGAIIAWTEEALRLIRYGAKGVAPRLDGAFLGAHRRRSTVRSESQRDVDRFHVFADSRTDRRIPLRSAGREMSRGVDSDRCADERAVHSAAEDGFRVLPLAIAAIPTRPYCQDAHERRADTRSDQSIPKQLASW